MSGLRNFSFGVGTSVAHLVGGAIPAIVRSYTDISSSARLNLSETQEWVGQAARKLEVIGTLRYDWDSYGGSPLKPQARAFTFTVLRWLSREDLPTPEVGLASNGTVQLEWRVGGKELDVGIGEGDQIEFVTVDVLGQIVEGREDSAPGVKLRDLTHWLMQQN